MGLLVSAIQVYSLIVLVRAIFSWLPVRHRQNEFYAFLYRITEPVLRPVRQVLPSIGGIDLSPLVVLFLLSLLARLLVRM